MTEPGSIDKVPLKVVPMYIDVDTHADVDAADDGAAAPAEPSHDPGEADSTEPETPVRAKTGAVGVLALGASILSVVSSAAGIVIATNGEYPVATALAYLAIGLSVVGIVAGVLAIVLDRGRRAGVGAAVLGLLANPYLLLVALEFLGGARS